MKLRILAVTEATYLNTGYSVYFRELLTRLSKNPNYEVAELACYASPDDPRIHSVPWPLICNEPSKNNEVETKEFREGSALNRFGAFKFEAACVHFKPHIVCCPPKTPVMTDGGYKNIEDISIGDSVLTHKNRFMPVTKTMKREANENIVSIYVNGCSEPIITTEDHPILIYRNKPQTNQKKSAKKIYENEKPVFVPAKYVKTKDLVVLPTFNSYKTYNLDISTYINNFITIDNKIYPKINNKNGIFRYVNVTPDFCRLIGYIIGDGHASSSALNLFFGINERRFAEDCKDLIYNIFGIESSIHKSKTKQMLLVSVNSVLLCEFLRKFIGIKLPFKKIPKEIITSTNECKEQLLSGLIRSDGCYKKNTVSFTTISKNLAYTYRAICASLGICVSIYKRKSDISKFYNVEAYGINAIKLHNISKKYQNISCPKTKIRDTSRIKYFSNKNHIVCKIRRIRKQEYKGQVYNLSVKNDESYTTNFCVHNCSIRDYWMDAYIDASPFRKYFKWIWMPTVDAYPQNDQWIDMYSRCDAILTYNDWSGKVLENQSLGKIKWQGSAPPIASSCYKPMDRNEIKKMIGFDPRSKIIGTVMRNQRRKLYPDLFEAFRKYLDLSQDNDTYLYCHTSYPDGGWDIPTYLKRNNICNKTLFTYVCDTRPDKQGNPRGCGHIFPSFFNDQVTFCPRCNGPFATMSNVHTGATSKDMANIYNLFDVYVQYANCLTPQTQILTHDWYKDIKNINIGDLVLTHKGQYKKVINKFEHTVNQKINQVKIWSDYELTNISDEHPVYCINNITREKLGHEIPNPKFVLAKNLKNNDILVQQIDDTIRDIDNIDLVKILELYDCAKYMYNDTHIAVNCENFYNRFIKIDNDFCRLLGLYIADGSTHINKNNHTIRITSHIDENINIELSNKVFSIIANKIPSIHKYKNRKAVDIEIYSSLLSELFIKFGKLENKALPDWAIYLPTEKQKNILQGLFMGDGHYLKSKNISIYVTISKKLSEQIKFILKRLRINYNVRIVIKKGNRKPQYRFEVFGNIKNNEFLTIRNNSRNFYYKNNYLVQIKNIQKIDYSGLLYNLEVEDDNSYVSNVSSLHNSEGFGIPLVEAAACSVPIMAIDYSAMSDILRKLRGIQLKPKALVTEIETGCFRAVPDNDDTANKLFKFFKLSQKQRDKIGSNTYELWKNVYSIDKTVAAWENCFRFVKPVSDEHTWNSPIKQFQSRSDIPEGLNNKQYIQWLLVNVLGQPERLNGYMELRMVKDLNFGISTGMLNGIYFNEQSEEGGVKMHEFNNEIAYNHLREMCERNNFWERVRCGQQ